MPRAFVVYRAHVVHSPAEAASALADPRFAPERVAIVEAPVADMAVADVDAAAPPMTPVSGFFRLGPADVTIEVTAQAPGVLVSSEVYYPGWRVTVDGIEVPLLRVDYALRGVALTKGAHVVAMTYEDLSTGLRRSDDPDGAGAVGHAGHAAKMAACHPGTVDGQLRIVGPRSACVRADGHTVRTDGRPATRARAAGHGNNRRHSNARRGGAQFAPTARRARHARHRSAAHHLPRSDGGARLDEPETRSCRAWLSPRGRRSISSFPALQESS